MRRASSARSRGCGRRPSALGATQFEALTAAALAEFAEQGVDAAVVEAGLGGRLDATNVLRAPVVVLTNVGLEHTEQLGETREEIAAEKLAVVQPGATVVLCEPEWEPLARSSGAGDDRAHRPQQPRARGRRGGDVPRRPGRSAPRPDAVRSRAGSSARGEAPLEIWDGAHNLDGVGWLLPRLPDRRYVVVASILARQGRGRDARRALRPRRHARRDDVGATPARCPPTNLQRLARRWFERTETEQDPGAALARARSIAGPDGAVLVTGSLYLLADLAAAPRRRTIRRRTRLSVYVFAAIVIARICRNRVRGGVRRREAPAVTSHDPPPLRRHDDHHQRRRSVQRRQRLLRLRVRGS